MKRKDALATNREQTKMKELCGATRQNDVMQPQSLSGKKSRSPKRNSLSAPHTVANPEPMIAVQTLTLKWLAQDDMQRLAGAIARCLRGGEVVSLEGELGSGKTFFVRQLAHALGYAHHVTSPTFVLQKLYDLPSNPAGLEQLIHYDVYRLTTYDELFDLGFDDLSPTAVALVEWGDRFAHLLPANCWRIKFSIADDSHRNVDIRPPQDRIAALQVELDREQLEAAISHE